MKFKAKPLWYHVISSVFAYFFSQAVFAAGDFSQAQKKLQAFSPELCSQELSKNSWLVLETPRTTRKIAVRPQNLRGFLPHSGHRPEMKREGAVIVLSSQTPPLDEFKLDVDCEQKILHMRVGAGETYHGWHLDLITGQIYRAETFSFSTDQKYLATLEFFDTSKKPLLKVFDCRPRKDLSPCRQAREFQTALPFFPTDFEQLDSQWSESGYRLQARWAESGILRSALIQCDLKNREVQTCR